MHYAAQFIAFIGTAFGLCIALWPCFGLRGPASWLCLGVSTSVLFTPLVVASQQVSLRALACVLAVELFFKTTDYAAQRRTASNVDHGFLSYAKFLVPFPVLLVRFGHRSRRPEFNWSRCYSVGRAMIAFVFGFALVELLSHVAMVRSSFLLDHTLKFIVFTWAIESLARSLYDLERFAGYDMRPLIDNAYRSRTVGEFWYRYNTRVHSWFDHNVFRPLGGRRAPVRAIFLTFLVSGLLHEIGFAITTSRIDGYQFTFFILQAPAIILWHRVQRATTTNFGKIVLHGSTILWMWATSMFFFHGVNRVFPFFYVSDPWLP